VNVFKRGLVYEKAGRNHAILLDGEQVGWLGFDYAYKGWVATGLPWFSEGRSFDSMRAARIAIADALVREEEKGNRP
jgi:hypothetical protein